MESYGSKDDEYCYMEHDDNDTFPVPVTEFICPTSFKVITPESLLDAQMEDLQIVMDLLSLKQHHARALLIHYRWDVDKVALVLGENGIDYLFKEAGVIVEDQNDLFSSPCSSALKCEVCFEEIAANETTTMDCRHCFCNNCWTKYLIVKINEGQSTHIRCMADKCNVICDESKIRNLVGVRDHGLVGKFDRVLVESYIDDNPRVKWCPSVPHCGNAIFVGYDKYCEVKCSCGLEFCFNCSSEAHSPCSCLMLELWTKKCKDESETVNWITVNTMPCPKCQEHVEKDGECDLVRCICGQTFCWLCGEATDSEISWNHPTCGENKQKHVEEKECAKKKLLRYLHCRKGYNAHADSFMPEINVNEKLQAELSKQENWYWKSKDMSWLTSVLYRYFRSRRILSYSYPFAYYMFGDDLFMDKITEEDKEIKQNLFEYQQQQLEANVKELTMLLKESFDDYGDNEVLETRIKIVNLSTITDKLCKKLYEFVKNDLLGPLPIAKYIIAPYRPKGVETASEISLELFCHQLFTYYELD